MIELKKYKGKEYASARELHKALGIKKNFSTWFKQNSHRAMIDEGIDFIPQREESTGGRRKTEFLLLKEAALSFIMLSGGKNAKAVRDEVLKVFKQRQDLELITPKEAALAYEYINFFKYIENQKEAYLLHQRNYIENNPPSKYVYADFAKHRANIVGWDKQKVTEAVNKYLESDASVGLKSLLKRNMHIQLSVINLNEAIRVSVLDLLFAKGTDTELANKFASMVKNVAVAMENLNPRKVNETDLFDKKENLAIPRSL